MWQAIYGKFRASIGAKIILPYLLLTLVVAGIGAFIVTSLVTSSLRERFNNQLLDAGRVVSEAVVLDEQERLNILRQIAFTTGVPESIVRKERESLALLITPIMGNSRSDVVVVLDAQGEPLYGWQRLSAESEEIPLESLNFAQVPDVQLVLNGYTDSFGNKRVFLGDMSSGEMIFTVGPIFSQAEQVGTVMIGTAVTRLVTDLTQRAIAKVTLYDHSGRVIATALIDETSEEASVLQEPAQQYDTVLSLLSEPSNHHRVVTTLNNSQVPLRQFELLNQTYQLAYGDWRLRDQSFGLFSVALPSNFIVTAAATSRNLLSLVFSVATVTVLIIGYSVSRRISGPLNRLVTVATSVAQGDLEQRTHIKRPDEIGILADSFDRMTENLSERNRQLITKASELEAIVHSIADGLVVFDSDHRIVTSNPAAQPLLPVLATQTEDAAANGTSLAMTTVPTGIQRYAVDNRIFSAVASPVKMPDGSTMGQVVVLRDITRETEAEQLKDNLITTVSHELRTPLTAIKGYLSLLTMSGLNNLDERQVQFIKVVNENTEALIEQVNKLIEITEIQNQALRLNQEEQNFVSLAAAVVESWQEQFVEKGVQLTFRCSDEVLRVYGDARRLTWAIDNLMANAFHYTLQGGRVEVCVFAEADQVHLSVNDTGIGISEKDQAYLFSRFFRIQHEETFNVRGLGLGLFIVKTIAELHGGRVWVESQPGVGSKFGLAIPLIHE